MHQRGAWAGVPLKHQHLAQLRAHLPAHLGRQGVFVDHRPREVESLAGEVELASLDVDPGEPGLRTRRGTPQTAGFCEMKRGGEGAAGAGRVTGLCTRASEVEQAVYGSGGGQDG